MLVFRFDSSYVWPDGGKGALFQYERDHDNETKNLEEMIVMPTYFPLKAEQIQALKTQNYKTGNNPDNSYSLGFLMEKQYEGFSEEGQNIEDFTAKHYSLDEKGQTTLNSLLSNLNELFYEEISIKNYDGTFTEERFPICNPNIAQIPIMYESIIKIEDLMKEYGIDKSFTAEQYSTMIRDSLSELVLVPGNKWGDLVVFLQESTNTDEPEKSSYSFNVGISIGPDYDINTPLIEDNLFNILINRSLSESGLVPGNNRGVVFLPETAILNEPENNNYSFKEGISIGPDYDINTPLIKNNLFNILINSISNALPAKLHTNLESKQNTNKYSPEENLKKIQKTIDSRYNNMSKTEKESITNRALQRMNHEQENANKEQINNSVKTFL